MGIKSADMNNRAQYTTAADANTRKATSTTAVQLGPMVKDGTYVLISDTACFFLQGASNVTPTTSTGWPLAAGQSIGDIHCDVVADNGYVGVILASGTGLAWLMRVS